METYGWVREEDVEYFKQHGWIIVQRPRWYPKWWLEDVPCIEIEFPRN